MLIKNLDFSLSLVNGSMGIVIDFDEDSSDNPSNYFLFKKIVVLFENGVKMTIIPSEFIKYLGTRKILTIIQIPLSNLIIKN